MPPKDYDFYPPHAIALLHYAEVSRPQTFTQIDGWVNNDGEVDSIVNPTGERLSLTGGSSEELWRGSYALRVHIRQETNQADVIALLEQAIEWVKSDWEYLKQVIPPTWENPEFTPSDSEPTGNIIQFDGDIPF